MLYVVLVPNGEDLSSLLNSMNAFPMSVLATMVLPCGRLEPLCVILHSTRSQEGFSHATGSCFGSAFKTTLAGRDSAGIPCSASLRVVQEAIGFIFMSPWLDSLLTTFCLESGGMSPENVPTSITGHPARRAVADLLLGYFFGISSNTS